jgi:Na+/proline symporter
MLALSYFGCDQSQVQRYLTGETVEQSRLGLLFNGMIKVPMQFFILFVGAMVFVFYQFVAPPLFFNTAERAKIGASRYAEAYSRLEEQHRGEFVAKRDRVRQLVGAMRGGNESTVAAATTALHQAQSAEETTRKQAAELIRRNDPRADSSDTNYVFLSFVIRFLPRGVVGLVLAAIFCAAMSATASGLNALASTTVVDVYRRFINPKSSEHDSVRVAKIMTIVWGVFAIGFAEFVGRMGSLIEAVNKLGSFFYGTILAIFIVAFFFREVGGFAVCAGAAIGEIAVTLCALFTNTAWLWWNVVGCVVGIAGALLVEKMLPDREPVVEPVG